MPESDHVPTLKQLVQCAAVRHNLFDAVAQHVVLVTQLGVVVANRGMLAYQLAQHVLAQVYFRLGIDGGTIHNSR